MTKNPRTAAGKAMLKISNSLSYVHTPKQAIAWLERLDGWWQVYGGLTKEKSYGKDKYGDEIWWWTHDGIRKSWNLLHTVWRRNHLFTYLDYGNPRVTSGLEGGINTQIREALRFHRGAPIEHERLIAGWWLYCHEHTRAEAWQQTKQQLAKQQNPQPQTPDEPPEYVSPYDTALTPEEGLWTRKGWAGRT